MSRLPRFSSRSTLLPLVLVLVPVVVLASATSLQAKRIRDLQPPTAAHGEQVAPDVKLVGPDGRAMSPDDVRPARVEARRSVPEDTAEVALQSANLRVYSFEFHDTNLIDPDNGVPAGREVAPRVALDIGNDGTEDILVDFDVELRYEPFDGGSYPLATQVVNGLAAFDIQFIQFDSVFLPPTLPEGPGSLVVELDATNAVVELDEGDNLATWFLNIEPPPLLDVAAYGLSAPSTVQILNDFSSQVVATVYSVGPDPTPPFSVQLVYSEDADITSTDVVLDTFTFQTGLGAGEIAVAGFDRALLRLDTPVGAGYLALVIDPDDMVEENDEQNNIASMQVTVVDNPTAACAYAEDFQTGAAGWTAIGFGAADNHWNRVDYDDGTTVRGVMWCGTDTPGFVAPPGYGNLWDDRLAKTFTLPPGTVTLDYVLQFDSEPGYDFTLVEISNDGGQTFSTLATHTGTSNGFEAHAVDLTGFAGQEVRVRFRFNSDSAWSDEDGLYVSNGGCRLDRVQVTGFPVDDFATSTSGWSAEASIPGYRWEAAPDCGPIFPCDQYSDGTPATTCGAWVAYDPDTGQFPAGSDGADVQIGIESPVISIPADATVVLLDFDVFSNLGLSDDLFYLFQVAAPADGTFRSSSSLYYGQLGWFHRSEDITSLVTPGATTLKIRLLGLEYELSFPVPTMHQEGPFFDNVKVSTYNSTSGGVDCSGFPADCGTIVVDDDGDGVPDEVGVDLCIGEDASGFDRDGDGCIDPVVSARHIEYWDQNAFPLNYVINDQGAPEVADGSDFIALQNAMSAWTDPLAIPGVEASVNFAGFTATTDADALDGINTITFADFQTVFPPGVLALGLTTSFTSARPFQGQLVRPGQIVDFDMIFNPTKHFKTPTAGPAGGVDIEGTAKHEAGHGFGLAHSSVFSSTMFYVLPPGATTLEPEDKSMMLRAYPDASTVANASRLTGTVMDGSAMPLAPAPGVIVFAISVATSDTSGCDYTMPDGSFDFVGLPDGDYYVAIHPLDGSAPIGFIGPANINSLVNGSALTTIEPEYWDTQESPTDDSTAKDPVTVAAGSPQNIQLITNVDVVGPVASPSSPLADAVDVPIDTAVLVSFSEEVDSGSLSGNFRLERTSDGAFVQGSAALLAGGTVISYVPYAPLDFSTSYSVDVQTGVTDLVANPLQSALNYQFITEAQPDVSLASLAPNKGLPGTLVAINGDGFESDPANNQVDMSGLTANVLSASPDQLLVQVPSAALPGDIQVTVTNLVQTTTSNTLGFTVLEDLEAARGFETDVVTLGGQPRSVSVLPNGNRAFVATDTGFSSVVVDPQATDYLALTSGAIAGGLDELDATSDNRFVFAVSRVNKKIYRINANSALGPIEVLNEVALSVTPNGILVDPAGKRAFVPCRPTGEILLWDANESSPTFDRQIGTIASPYTDVRGKMATDPSGTRLLGLTGTGKCLVFDVPTRQLIAEIVVGLDPRDVVVDPNGLQAFVTDDHGQVAVVSMTTFEKIRDIRTGGKLRGMDIADGGSFLYAANRDLDFLDVVDLRTGSPTLLDLTARIEQRTNPVDVVLSPDRLYAYSVVETDRQLVINSIGIGPVIDTVSRRHAPEGAKLVLTGSGFTDDPQTRVSLHGQLVVADRLTDTSLTITVPPAATDGPVTVVGVGQQTVSNAINLKVLGPSPSAGLRLAATEPSAPGGANGGSTIAASVTSSFVAIGDADGGFHVLDTNESSPTFHEYIGSMSPGAVVDDVVLASDGIRAFLLRASSSSVDVVDVNRNSAGFMTGIGTVDLSAEGGTLGRLSLSPDDRLLLVSNPGLGSIHAIDVDPDSPQVYQLSATVGLSDAAVNGVVGAMAFHPAGTHAYLAIADEDPAVVRVLGTDPTSGDYLQVISTATLPGSAPQELPTSMAFTPDGQRAVVLTQGTGAPSDRHLVLLDATDPTNPVVGPPTPLGVSVDPSDDGLVVSPRGDRVLVDVHDTGLFRFELQTDPDVLVPLEQVGNPADFASAVGTAYAADASGLFVLAAATNQLFVYDFAEVGGLVEISGNNQSGVADQILASPLRVQVTGPGGPVEGVAVSFAVTSGGGFFEENGLPTRTVPTNGSGLASTSVRLGPALGPQTVQASVVGVAAPVVFTANAGQDPLTLPLTIASLSPAADATGVSKTSAVQVSFSRAVDPATVTSSTFSLAFSSAPVAGTLGFADGNRRVSFTPGTALLDDAPYTLSLTTGVQDASGGALSAPSTTTFHTAPAPVLHLAAVNPPSASVKAWVTLSGEGFLPGNSQVLFNGSQATIAEAGIDFITVRVPFDATSGDVTMVVGGQTSNALPFTVLLPTSQPPATLLDTVGTSSSVRAIAVLPNGSTAYAVSPDNDVVVPIDLINYTTLPGIFVGENPYALAIHPDGKTLYVTNLYSGTISVIDTNPVSPRFHEVVATIRVGLGPTDVVVSPDGDRVIVANILDENLSIIDGDATSATFNSVLGNAASGTRVQSLAISPDGGRLYAATDNGYIILDTVAFGVLGQAAGGTSVRSVKISPDGTMLAVLATNGEVLLFDVVPGSPTEGQVLGHAGSTTSAQTLAISPDGGLLYMPQQSGDVILVASLSLSSGVSVLGPDAAAEPEELTIVDTVQTGENPSHVSFTPDGTLVVSNAGDNTVSVIGTDGPVPVLMQMARFEGSTHDGQTWLHWQTATENSLEGFHVFRTERGSDADIRLTESPLPARGQGTEYSLRDPDALLNRVYLYTVQGLAQEGAGPRLGPYEVTFRAPFALKQNAPNPFNPKTKIVFTVPRDGHVRLVVYDVAGRRVKTLVDQWRKAREYVVVWDGTDRTGRAVASGVYFYRLQAGGREQHRKMLLLK